MSGTVELTRELQYKKHKLTIDGRYADELRDVVPEDTWSVFCARTNGRLEDSRKRRTGRFEDCVEAFFSLGGLAFLGGFWLMGNKLVEIGLIVMALGVPFLLVGGILWPFLHIARRRWLNNCVEDALQDTAKQLMDDCRGTGLAVEIQRGHDADAPWLFVFRVDTASLETLPAYLAPAPSSSQAPLSAAAPPAPAAPNPFENVSSSSSSTATPGDVLIPGLEELTSAPPAQGAVYTLPPDAPLPPV